MKKNTQAPNRYVVNNRPQVGIGVIVMKDGKILLGKRTSAHGEGAWCYPGGHLEYGESWEECARREVMEEAGIEITHVRFGTVTNDIFEKEQKHYVTICVLSEYAAGAVRVMEPDKCEQWNWFTWDALPQPLFLPVVNQLKEHFHP